MTDYFDKSLMSFANDLADGKIKVGVLPTPPPITPVVGEIGVTNRVPGFVVEQTTVPLAERHVKGTPATRYTFGQKVRSRLGLHKDETLGQKAQRWGKAWKKSATEPENDKLAREYRDRIRVAKARKLGTYVGAAGGMGLGLAGAAAGADPMASSAAMISGGPAGYAAGGALAAGVNKVGGAVDRLRRFAKRNAELKRRAPNKPEFRGGEKSGFVKKEHEEFLSGIVAEYKLDCTNEELDYFLEEFLLADSTNNLTEDWLPLIEDFSPEAIQERATVSQAPQHPDVAKRFGPKADDDNAIQTANRLNRDDPDPVHRNRQQEYEKLWARRSQTRQEKHDEEAREKAKKLKADYVARMRPGVEKPSRPMQRNAVRSRIRELEAKGRPTNESRFGPAFHERFGPKASPSGIADDLTDLVFEFADVLNDDTVVDSFCTEVLGESIDVLTEQRGGWGGGSSYRDRQRNMERANRTAEISDRNQRDYRGANAPKKEGLFSLLRQWIGASLKSKIKAAEARGGGVSGDDGVLDAAKAKLKALEGQLERVAREKDALARDAQSERMRRQQLASKLDSREKEDRENVARAAHEKERQQKIARLQAESDRIDAEIEKAGAALQQAKRANNPTAYGARIRELEQQINTLSAQHHKVEQQLDALHPG